MEDVEQQVDHAIRTLVAAPTVMDSCRARTHQLEGGGAQIAMEERKQAILYEISEERDRNRRGC